MRFFKQKCEIDKSVAKTNDEHFSDTWQQI